MSTGSEKNAQESIGSGKSHQSERKKSNQKNAQLIRRVAAEEASDYFEATQGISGPVHEHEERLNLAPDQREKALEEFTTKENEAEKALAQIFLERDTTPNFYQRRLTIAKERAENFKNEIASAEYRIFGEIYRRGIAGEK